MSNLNVKSVMLDTSFIIRLMDESDPLHQNALDYFKYFQSEKITTHISTVAIAEYGVEDDVNNLPLNYLQIEAFDFRDAEMAGKFYKEILNQKKSIANFNRKVIANDVKIFAQTHVKQIESVISKDVKSYSQFLKPLIDASFLQIRFIDLNTPLSVTLGKLF